MQISCGCCLGHLEAVTIKCIDKTDGTTIWEYGPGALWRHHYGADAISGVVPNLSATLNKYAIAAGSYPTFNACGNRNTATLTANVCEPLEVVKLNSLDGSTIESATLTGLFCDVVTSTSVGLVSGQTMTNAAALSGGDFVIVGERVPFVEFNSFASNTATKSYILHAHGLRDGNVYLKTRTSDETITIPYDSTATEVEALFEATADCTAATVTGGPWPLLPITVEATWSVSGGDISAIATTGTYTATGVGTDASWGLIDDGIDQETFTLTVNTLTVGSTWEFQFDGTGGGGAGTVFTYTSATTNASTFITDLADAMLAYAIAHSAEADWAQLAGGTAITTSGNQISITYTFAIRHLTLAVDGGGATDTRRAAMCAASYDTGTGDMVAAVGFEFGYSEDRTPLKMFAETADLPGTTGLNVLGILSIGSGPSNAVIVTPQLRGLGDEVKSNVVEQWSIAGSTWTFNWQVYCNAEMAMPAIIPCESGYVVCPINAKRFDSINERTAARLAVSDATTVELMTTFGSITAPDNQVVTAMFDDTPGTYFSWGYDILYQDAHITNNRFRTNGHGADTWIDETEYRLGGVAFGCDGTQVYATLTTGISNGWHYDGFGVTTDTSLFIKYFAPATSRAAEPQQFRFRVARMPGTNYTAWLDWYATESEIETALSALLGAGNVNVEALVGDAALVANSPTAFIEMNPRIEFLVDSAAPGGGRIPSSYFTFRSDGVFIGLTDIVIEMQTITPFADPPGIAAFDAATANYVWSRAFGTALVGGATVSNPLHAWLQGDYVYAYGQLLENELP